MFSKLAAVITISSVALSASAGHHRRGSQYQCNTGPVQCCNQLAESQSGAATAILALVGLSAQGLSGQVGAVCSPFTVVGVGSGANCATQPVCCDKNYIGGLVSLGCSPVNLCA
uniref:Hydrophobin n=1 Tax=Hypsizygus marmoreus TaxID=39966 RepID=A0A0A7DLA4_HYPMA|nr:hydrophobin [Hypsizygus marmoreus]